MGTSPTGCTPPSLPVTFATALASAELKGHPQAKTMTMTPSGYRHYTVYYRQGGGACGGGWGAHKCMAEIEFYDF